VLGRTSALVPDFIAYAKASPGKLNMASGGVGDPGHVAGELFKMIAGVTLVDVPYRGAGPAVIDLLRGQVDVIFNAVATSVEYIKAGKLHALAVTTAVRCEALPDRPTISDFVPGYEASGLYGIGVPRRTPAGIIYKLNKEVKAGLNDPKIKAQLGILGALVLPGSSTDFANLIGEETEKWGRVVKFSGAKPE
jgi:tripartite-type tricarboxylate transporter receptor subunit TctC